MVTHRYHRDGVTDLSKIRDEAIRYSAGSQCTRTVIVKLPSVVHHHAKEEPCQLETLDNLDDCTQEHEVYNEGAKVEAHPAAIKMFIEVQDRINRGKESDRA